MYSLATSQHFFFVFDFHHHVFPPFINMKFYKCISRSREQKKKSEQINSCFDLLLNLCKNTLFWRRKLIMIFKRETFGLGRCTTVRRRL